MADVVTARAEALESEKGKLDATKDAVDSILKNLEQMKASVSFEEQRRHDFVIERNKKLMNILRYSEQVRLSKQILATAINNESVSQLRALQDSLNETILNLRTDLMFLIVFHENIGKDSNVTTFGDKIFTHAVEVVVNITNAISIIESKQKQFDYAMTLEDDELKHSVLQQAMKNKTQLEEMKTNPKYKTYEGYETAETGYLVYLSGLYKSDVFLKYTLVDQNAA